MPNNGHLSYMQDGAPSHTAAATKEELCERGVPIIIWPPYSPDLNPIETVWNLMKDWIQDNYGEQFSYDTLRVAVKEAWDTITEQQLAQLLQGMKDRCQAVIDANGMHTRF